MPSFCPLQWDSAIKKESGEATPKPHCLWGRGCAGQTFRLPSLLWEMLRFRDKHLLPVHPKSIPRASLSQASLQPGPLAPRWKVHPGPSRGILEEGPDERQESCLRLQRPEVPRFLPKSLWGEFESSTSWVMELCNGEAIKREDIEIEINEDLGEQVHPSP